MLQKEKVGGLLTQRKMNREKNARDDAAQQAYNIKYHAKKMKNARECGVNESAKR